MSEGMKKQAVKALDKARALNSPVLQQVLIAEVEKIVPGWFEAGGELDISSYLVTMTVPYQKSAETNKLTDAVDFWTLPANCLSCTTTYYVFSRTKTFVMPQYNDVEIKLGIQLSWKLPAEDLQTLRMLGKVSLEAPVTCSPSSYREVVVCKKP